jgi:hypothetical protein
VVPKLLKEEKNIRKNEKKNGITNGKTKQTEREGMTIKENMEKRK